MKRSPLVVIFTTVFIDLVGFGIVIPVLPFYAEGTAFNATPRTVGLLFASYSIMQLIFSPVLGGLSDKYGRRPVLLRGRGLLLEHALLPIQPGRHLHRPVQLRRLLPDLRHRWLRQHHLLRPGRTVRH